MTKRKKEFFEFLDFARAFDFEHDNDREIVIVGCAYIESLIKAILREFLVQDKKELGLLLDESKGALPGLVQKARILYLMNVFPKVIFEDIRLVARIRNHFAHNVFAIFNDESVVKNIKKMKWYIESLKMGPPEDATIRDIYQVAVNQLVSHLVVLPSSARYKRSKKNFEFKIKCSKETFKVLKTDERFLSLLTIARVVNALRFCQKAGIDAKNSQGLSSAGSIANSALFASSVMYEGLRAAEKLGKHFKDIDSYKNGFGALLKDKKIKSFSQTALKRMRNKFVFHFDSNVMAESFRNFELPEYIFAAGVGKTSGEMYFVLADDAVFNYLLEPEENESDESLQNRYIEILRNSTGLMQKFTESAENLMVEVLPEMGFAIETIRRQPKDV